MATSSREASNEELLRRVNTVSLPEPVAELADEYQALFGDRDRFLWQWIYSLFPAFTLPSVPTEHEHELRTQKTRLTMYVTILDDLAETHGDISSFRQACRLAVGPDPIDRDRVDLSPDQFALIERVWREFADGIADAPRYDEFAPVFEYDLSQTTNSMRYSALLNEHPHIANLDGARRYDAHNMTMFPYADVDLMFSPGVALEDLGALRSLLWDLQELARIGNWLTTWERELEEGDYTAGVTVEALQEGIIAPADLEGDPADVIETIRGHGVERRFRNRWQRLYAELRTREFETESVDLDELVRGMETVFTYHRASRGEK